MSDVLYLIPQLLDYFLTIISLERSMWEGPKRIIWHWDQHFICLVFFHHGYVLFCETILYSGNCRIFRDLAFGSVKTRFKAILKKLDFSAQIDLSAQNYLWTFAPGGRLFGPDLLFSWTVAPGGRLSYEAYNVFTCLIYIYIYIKTLYAFW